jgi:hypothetical protein
MKTWGGGTSAASVRHIRTKSNAADLAQSPPTHWRSVVSGISLARFQRTVGRPNSADDGFCRSEDQELVLALQAAVVQDQIVAHDHRGRSCRYCGQYRRIKDWRRRQIDTALGRVRVRIPRVVSCQCLPEPLDEGGEITVPQDSESTVERLLPKRRTPEVSYLMRNTVHRACIGLPPVLGARPSVCFDGARIALLFIEGLSALKKHLVQRRHRWRGCYRWALRVGKNQFLFDESV